MFKCEYKVESDVLWVWESAFRLAHIQTYVYENAIPLAAWCAFDFNSNSTRLTLLRAKPPAAHVPDPTDSPSDIAIPLQHKDEDGHH